MTDADTFAEIRNAKAEEPKHNLRLDKTIAPQGETRTWAYYQRIKKADPKSYERPEVEVQMQKDALRLGPSFFVTDDND
ncbi:hypothetical protein SAMN05216304_11558 [Bosea sp. OK403]|uniref:hypothetical protein n=1 Tax=Bosea sp. OK403 TaxID=1855286 RepID=UPI0008E03D4D|nr:hypothetical protein [Bosea sp. OK403]SFJ80722.1 hypothetical protein SAMN05216304_11558 [Bosea sp. OK403]